MNILIGNVLIILLQLGIKENAVYGILIPTQMRKL